MKTSKLLLLALFVSILIPLSSACADEAGLTAAQLSLSGEVVSELASGGTTQALADRRVLHPALLSLQGEVIERALAPSADVRYELPAFACLR